MSNLTKKEKEEQIAMGKNQARHQWNNEASIHNKYDPISQKNYYDGFEQGAQEIRIEDIKRVQAGY